MIQIKCESLKYFTKQIYNEWVWKKINQIGKFTIKWSKVLDYLMVIKLTSKASGLKPLKKGSLANKLINSLRGFCVYKFHI